MAQGLEISKRVMRRTRSNICQGQHMTEQNTAIEMKCIEDGHILEQSSTSGALSSRCPVCRGAWLTEDALHEIEDRSFDPEMVKGQMRYGEHPTEHSCPHCGEKMTRFRYRGYNLEIEACPNRAGYWLDHGEDEHIKDVMKERVRGLRRSVSAQQAWRRTRRGEKLTLFDRIRNLFR